MRRLPGVAVEELDDLEDPALSDDPRRQLAVTLELFRMRAALTRMSQARVVFRGHADTYAGRFPGIVEEVALSLASGQPVYVCGGFGGAAEAVGEVLGLGRPWATVPACLDPRRVGEWLPWQGEAAMMGWSSRWEARTSRRWDLRWGLTVWRKLQDGKSRTCPDRPMCLWQPLEKKAGILPLNGCVHSPMQGYRGKWTLKTGVSKAR